MSKVEVYQLCHPELLSEGTLCEILKNSCIELPTFKTLNKEELIEIFKRIALPMPQRQYNESRRLGKTLSDLRTKRGINIANYSENTDLLSAAGRVSETKIQTVDAINSSIKSRLKPSVSETQQNSKKIRLLNSCQLDSASGKDIKRKNEVSSSPESKKRQKITWP